MLRKLLTLIFISGLLVPAAFAQNGTVSGTVTDAQTGEAIPGVNIVLRPIQRGTATGKDGNYSISNVPTGQYTLRATFVGYNAFTKKIQVTGGQNQLNIELKQGQIGLNQLVVTGYSTQSRQELTGSVATVDASEVQDVPFDNTQGILQGRATGVRLTRTSGTAGSGFDINVRGTSAINAGTRPLYVVDGVQLSFSNIGGNNDTSPLNTIPPDNIKSIQVLKDAAATAIYGSQGANGVVLIQTKHGVAGETRVSASYTRGTSDFIRNNTLFNRDQFIEFRIAAIQHDNPGITQQQAENAFRQGILPIYGLDPNADFSTLPNTDFYDFNTHTGITQNFRATVSGGTKQSRYRISGGYQDDESYIRTNEYKNYSLSANFDQQLSSKFSTSESINLSNQDNVGPCQDGFFINCPITQATFSSPLARPFLPDGTISPFFPIIGPGQNPGLQLNPNKRRRDKNTVAILGNISATYDFKPYLNLSTKLGLDYRSEDQTNFRDSDIAPGVGGQVFEDHAPTSNFLTTTTLNFNKSFADVNNVSALLGFEYRRNYTRQISSFGTGFPVQSLKVLGATANPQSVGGFNSEFRRASYFGRAQYNYDQRYFITFTGRYDGSSVFGANDRFGFFPAASVGWSIIDEDFFNADFVSTLKIRGSAGQSGNSQIGNFAARGLFSSAPRGPVVTYNGSTGLRSAQLANPDLTWLTVTQYDIGLDYGFVNSRVTGTFDIYRKNTNDLLLNSPLPVDSGFNSITRNVGKVRNQGVEFDVKTVNIRRGGFQWSTRFNISINQNEVRELTGGTQALNPGSATNNVTVGHPINAIKAVPYAGVNPADGRPFWYDIDGNLTYTPLFNNDARFLDSEDADAYGGFGTTLRYKGLALNAFFQFNYGGTIAPQQVAFFNLTQVGGSFTNGLVRRLTDAWRKPGDLAGYPSPTGNFFFSESSFTTASRGNSGVYFRSDYLRLKNVGLSYSLPVTLTQKIGLRDIRLHVTGLNLITWTSFPGFGPEIVNQTSNSGGNDSAGSIPVGRSVTGGITVKF